MAAEPIVEPIVEPIIAPALELVPDWVPQPDTVQPYGGPLASPHWEDVWNWIKDHAILPEGRPVTAPYASPAQVQQMIDAATGAVTKAMGGFVNQAVQLEVDNFNHLEAEIAVGNGARVADFGVSMERIRRAEVRIHTLETVVVPALLRAIGEADQRAQVRILQSEARSEHWAMENVFKPLIETIFADEQAAVLREQAVRADAIKHANDLNTNLNTKLAAEIAPVAATALALSRWVDDCGEPMCQTMGPKTDLGKILKALKVAGWIALLAELGALRADGLEGLIADISGWGADVIDAFESVFFAGGKTLAATLAGLPG